MKFYTNFKVQVIVFIILFSASSVMADSITKPYTFSASTPASASEVNANFDTVYDQVNKIGAVINVDSANERIGIGTTNPEAKLEIAGHSGLDGSSPVSISIYSENTGDWDDGSIFAQLLFSSADGHSLNNRTKCKIVSVTEGTTGALNGLAFYTREAHGNYLFERMRINSSGKIGIGTTSPNRQLSVNGDAGGTEAWYTDSDERLKKNVTTIENALEKVQNLRGVSFEWKDTENHPEGKQIGFIAQESKDIVPEVIDKKGEYYSMQYAPLTALLVEAVKEMKTELDDLKAENETLKAVICEEFPEKGICK